MFWQNIAYNLPKLLYKHMFWLNIAYNLPDFLQITKNPRQVWSSRPKNTRQDGRDAYLRVRSHGSAPIPPSLQLKALSHKPLLRYCATTSIV